MGHYTVHSPIEFSELVADEIVRVTYRWMGTTTIQGDNGPQTVPDVKEETLNIPLSALADNLATYYHVKYVVGGGSG
jgi:hypothetical protein